MFKLIFPSKTFYVSLLLVTINLQSQTVAEETKRRKNSRENYMTDSLRDTRYIVKYSTFGTTLFFCS
jgi:hypothetical protein